MDDEDRKTIVSSDSSNWSESVEDLLSSGDTSAAISLLESIIAGAQSSSPESDRRIVSALEDLAVLYSSTGFSLKADELRSRASLVRHRLLHSLPPQSVDNPDSSLCNGNLDKTTSLVSSGDKGSDDDWEVIADISPDKLLSTLGMPGVSEISLEDNKPKVPKRRGRGTFSYRKQELYSDSLSSSYISDNLQDEDAQQGLERNAETGHSTYGTRHVLLLENLSPRTETIDLEKLFVDFRDRGVVIRWINDTTALAVFGTPSIALEAKNRVACPFTVNILDYNNDLLSSIPSKDLEPPLQRPESSPRTARRMIAQGLGLKLTSTSFGSKELKEQESERRNRIKSRQKLKDDAWGTDD